MTPGMPTMARPKTKAKKKTVVAPPVPEGEERTTVVNLKGSPEYVAWLDRIHGKTHIPKTSIFRLAIAEWAKSHGHESPPEI